jgi:hypothetical protein
MKLSKRIKINIAKFRQPQFVPTGYFANRPSLCSKLVGAGDIGRIEGVRLFITVRIPHPLRGMAR